jgi:hypothetical protein
VSTILKALKRLDEQRRADAAPRSLEEQVLAGGGASGADPDAGRNRKLYAAIGAAGALALGGAAWFATREKPAAPAPPVAAATPRAPLRDVVAAAPREALPREGAPVAGTALDGGVRTQLRPDVARAAEELRRASALPAAGHQPEPGVGVEAELLAQDAARSGSSASEPAPPPQPAPRFAARPAREPDAEPVPSAAPAAIAPAPADAELPTSPAPEAAVASEADAEPQPPLVSARPEVWVERTQWHPSAQKRSALVRVGAAGEVRELHEGDALDGVVVKEIRPSGVLFLYDGAEFKRGVGGG